MTEHAERYGPWALIAGGSEGTGLSFARRLVDLNCHGPVVLCHRLGRSMRERGRGGIILLGSMSGIAGSAWVATCSATKSFEVVLAEALWAELRPFGVDVLALVAGATDTSAMARSGIGFAERDGMSPMQPDEVAEEGLAHLARGPVHVAGVANRATAAFLLSDRGRAIELLSEGAARLYGKAHPLEVTRAPSLRTNSASEK